MQNNSFYRLQKSKITIKVNVCPLCVLNQTRFRFDSGIWFCRGKNQRGKGTSEEYGGANEADSRPCEPAEVGFQNDASPSRKAVESEGAVTSLQDRTKWPELNAVKKVSALCNCIACYLVAF